MRATVAVVGAGSALALAGTVLAAVNLRHLRVPRRCAAPVTETVSVLVPMRDEAGRAGSCLTAIAAQRGNVDLEIVVLDDGSTDGTADVARAALHGVAGARVVSAPDLPPPDGWLGKPWACERLRREARGSVLVLVDADVVLEPDAVAAAVSLLRASGLDLLCPYPRQLADGALPRLVQPLLQWSWLTTVPLRAAEGSRRESLAVANGQFLVVDAAALERAGGYGAVGGEVLEDVALLRALKRSGGRGTVADGTELATCRMYDSGSELVAGYTKSLWSAFGSPPGAAGVMALLCLTYVVPPVAVVLARSPATRAVGAAGYAAAVAGRVLVARRTGQRVLPDALAHPASIVALAALTGLSWRGRRAGTLAWKGRPVEVAG